MTFLHYPAVDSTGGGWWRWGRGRRLSHTPPSVSKKKKELLTSPSKLKKREREKETESKREFDIIV